MDKKKYDIISKHFAVPLFEMAHTYTYSALTVENKVVSKKVAKKFEELMAALREQLDEYRK